MSSQKPKGPSIVMPKQMGTPFGRGVLIPETVVDQDPYADLSQTVNTRKTRGQFRVIEFTRAIRQHGYYIEWRKAMLCPCMNAQTGQCEINCTSCNGSGFFYFDPIEIRGIMSRFERNVKAFEKFGAWVEGTAQLTVEPMHRMAPQDQIELLDSIMTHSEVISKDDRRGRRSVLPVNRDAARYRIARMIRAVLSDDAHQMIALQEGVDFKITKEGWIEWLPHGQQIPEGTTISLLYEYHPIYCVVSHTNAFREGSVEAKQPVAQITALPVQMLIKLDHLVHTQNMPSIHDGPLPKYKIEPGC